MDRIILKLDQVYKDAYILGDEEEYAVKRKLEEADKVQVKKILKFQDIKSFIEVSGSEREELDIFTNIHKLHTYQGDVVFFLYSDKEIDSLINEWERFIIKYEISNKICGCVCK